MAPTTVITGVSQGLGAELFAQLHGRGHRVIGIGRRFTDTQRELAASQPGRVLLRQADLADLDTLPNAAELSSWLGEAEAAALVHNAAVVGPIGPVGTLPADQLAQAVTINMTAPLLLTNAFLAALPQPSQTRVLPQPSQTRVLPQPSQARVLFVSSGAAHRVVEGWAAYCATKRGGEMFFDTVAAQFADEPQIQVASVNPGVMDTAMQQHLREADFPSRDRYVTLHTQGQLPDPATVAQDLITQYLIDTQITDR